jgi:hypothetical protein
MYFFHLLMKIIGYSKTYVLIIACLISPANLCIKQFDGYDVRALTAKPYWIFEIRKGCNILTGQEKKCQIYASFCKYFESIKSSILNYESCYKVLLFCFLKAYLCVMDHQLVYFIQIYQGNLLLLDIIHLILL